ncbi:MAG: DNA-binding protein [Candidatus Chloroheliales bacterium]|nr:MAG: DNA-binding protein [Chloroflexota bacterium]
MSETEADQSVEEATIWLTLHQACELLGVAASTARRWGDGGRIKVERTPGGHRRFERESVLALVSAEGPAITNKSGIGNSEQALARQSWHEHFSPEVVVQMRGLGQRLLGLLIQYLVREREDARFISDGREVAKGYGKAASAAGVNLHDTVEAFLYFRANFGQLALQMPSWVQETDAIEMRRAYLRIDQFMNEVLLGTIDGYNES